MTFGVSAKVALSRSTFPIRPLLSQSRRQVRWLGCPHARQSARKTIGVREMVYPQQIDIVSNNTPRLVGMSSTWNSTSIQQHYFRSQPRRPRPPGPRRSRLCPPTISIRHGITAFDQFAVHFAGSTTGVTAVTKTVGVTSIWPR